MQLSDEDIDSFIEAYRTDTGETLSREEAFRAAHRVLTFFRVLAEVPDPDEMREDEENSGDPPPPPRHISPGDEP